MQFIQRLFRWLIGFNINRFTEDINLILNGMLREIDEIHQENESLSKQNTILLDLVIDHSKRLDANVTMLLAHQKVLEHLVGSNESDNSYSEWVTSDKKNLN